VGPRAGLDKEVIGKIPLPLSWTKKYRKIYILSCVAILFKIMSLIKRNPALQRTKNAPLPHVGLAVW
jgi:hypothetical protein